MGKQAKKKAERREQNEFWARLRAEGVVARMTACQAALNRPDVGNRLRERFTASSAEKPLTELDQVREVALRCLREDFGLDTRDVLITLDWQPHGGGRLTFSVAPGFAAVQRINEEIEAAKKAGRREVAAA